MEKNKTPSKVIGNTDHDKSLDAAIERVYQRYGTDLNAFLRDICHELALKRQEPSFQKKMQ